METKSELSWYALRTLPQREDMVKKLLIYRGLQAFTKTEKRAHHLSPKAKKLLQKREEREYVAAPGYVFVEIGWGAQPDGRKLPPDPWQLVHNCHLIRSVVSYNNMPARLRPHELIQFFRFDDFNMPASLLWFATDQEPFAEGDMVRIENPSFAGFTLPVKNIQRGEAIFDLVMMGRNVEVRFPLSQCYKAKEAEAA